MKQMYYLAIAALLVVALNSCEMPALEQSYSFDKVPDRTWIGEDFWSIPLEDWRVRNGRVECVSNVQQAKLTLLPFVLAPGEADFRVSFRMGIFEKGRNKGSSGIILGLEALEENDIRAAAYFGSGVSMGVHTDGFAFIEQQRKQLPDNFQWEEMTIVVSGSKQPDGYVLEMQIVDPAGDPLVTVALQPEKPLAGGIQLVNNFRNAGSRNYGPHCWFDDLQVSGPGFTEVPGNRFGPVLWSMYTLNDNVLKMSAQMPPVGNSENQKAQLQVKKNEKWQTVASGNMDPDARNVLWRLEEWDSSADHDYRILFDYVDSRGLAKTAEYAGIIRRDPAGRPLRVGALTCQFHLGFPYTPLVRNLALSNPDLLYFSGDQIYEQNGGYPIKRWPEDTAIVNYLGKWMMFGWAFGDIMLNVPTICTPDDHDVYHGNLWGEGGVPYDNQEIIKTGEQVNTGSFRGFAQTVGFVNAVNRTQCAHLPDPFDPTPIEQGMSVWYTKMNYGRISFAIVTDRIFKSSPERVATWEGRHDHLVKPLADPKALEVPGLELLGARQEAFLNEWLTDWRGADMKVLLSQTLFANVATHHGNFNDYLFGDLDSGGWPKKARDWAVDLMRKGFVFHLVGDQHVASIVQYGIDDYRDAGYCYCTAALSTGYSRWFRPDEMGTPVANRPAHGHPNTGEYTDAFGNKNYVYAIGNPGNFTRSPNRYETKQVKGSGFGMVILDQKERTITMESWRFLADILNPGQDDQHPGWPLTISQFDNYGRKPVAWLPELVFEGWAELPVVKVTNEQTGELVYIVRVKEMKFRPWVFGEGTYTVFAGDPDQDIWKTVAEIPAEKEASQQQIIIKFE